MARKFCYTKEAYEELKKQANADVYLNEDSNYIPLCIGWYLHKHFGIDVFEDMTLEFISDNLLVFKVWCSKGWYHIALSPKSTAYNGHKDYFIDGCW